MLILCSWALSTLAAPLADGVEHRVVVHEQARYHVVTVDLRKAALELHGQYSSRPDRSYQALKARLGDRLIAATNAGIFHSPDLPVGLFVSASYESAPLQLADGDGNFFLKPNGVFWIDGRGAHVGNAASWTKPDGLQLATQSGPALVLGGRLHTALLPKSTSKKVRNAVGVSDRHTVHLVLSDERVRFYDLATLMRDVLGCADALYLDGTISGMWGPGLPTRRDNEVYAGLLAVVVRP
ncbi:MAG: phosphodiester glycosidase family protein [Myxococcales bacterium]|nr:phosphodiester glycosidase family protein [Myxococcales bacterium]